MFRLRAKSNKLGNKATTNHRAWLSHFIGDYASLIRPYAFIARSIGFLPYKIVASQFVVSKLFLAFSTVLTIIYLNCIFTAVYKNNILYTPDRHIYRTVHTTFIIVLGTVIFISIYVANRSMVRAMENVSKVSQILPPEFFTKSAKIIFTKDAILCVPPFVHLLYLLWIADPAFSAICWYIFFGIMIINCLYTNNIYVLIGCLQQINDSLVKIKENLINDEPHLLRRVYHMQKNPVLLSKLRALKEQHLKICEALQALNDSFSMQNIAIITLLVVDITINMYIYLVIHNKGGRIRTWKSFRLLFIIYHCLHIIMLVWYTESVRTQIEQIGSNIHRIIVRTFDEQVITELEMFSLQVLQKDCTLVAKGLVIDATLLTKVLCSITTFMLILIQFSLAKPC